MRGVAEDERAHPLRPRGGEVLRDQPADREPAEDDLADAQVVEEAGKVGRVAGDRIGRGPEVGEAVAALVVAQEREVSPRSAATASQMRKSVPSELTKTSVGRPPPRGWCE